MTSGLLLSPEEERGWERIVRPLADLSVGTEHDMAVGIMEELRRRLPVGRTSSDLIVAAAETGFADIVARIVHGTSPDGYLLAPEAGRLVVIALGLGCTGSADRYLGALSLAAGHVERDAAAGPPQLGDAPAGFRGLPLPGRCLPHLHFKLPRRQDSGRVAPPPRRQPQSGRDAARAQRCARLT